MGLMMSGAKMKAGERTRNGETRTSRLIFHSEIF